jgi:hypothetical protein
MTRSEWFMVLAVTVSLVAPGVGYAADSSKVKAATNQVEQGAQKIPEGKIGDGVAETARGIGKTVSEGAQYSAEKVKEAGRAAEPTAKSAWAHTRDGAVGFGHSVKLFFASLFSR